MIFQHVTAAVLQVNQAIEANIVRPELPEEADRVEQLLVIIISFYWEQEKGYFAIIATQKQFSQWANCYRLSSGQSSKGSTISTRRWRSGFEPLSRFPWYSQSCYCQDSHDFQSSLFTRQCLTPGPDQRCHWSCCCRSPTHLCPHQHWWHHDLWLWWQ